MLPVAISVPLLLTCSTPGDRLAGNDGGLPGGPDGSTRDGATAGSDGSTGGADGPIAGDVDAAPVPPDAAVDAAPVPPDAAVDAIVPVDLEVCDDGQAPFARLADAIAAALPGATLLVCAGVYAENLSIVGKSLTIRGTGGAAATIIDGGRADSVLVVRQTGGAGVTVEGLTLRNGLTPGRGGGIRCEDSTLYVRDSVLSANEANLGGGLHSAACTLDVTGTWFDANHAGNGGGLYLDGGAAAIRTSQVVGNSARTRGAGLYVATDAVIEDSTIASNNADWTGGGVYVHERTTTFRGNTIRGNYAFNDGGGMYFHWGTPTIVDNRIEDNRTDDDGGGIRLFTSTAHVENNLIRNNRAGDSGGGVRVSHLPSVFINNFIRDNEAVVGGGIDMDNDSSQIRGGAITGNEASRGGGIDLVLAPWNGALIEDVLIAENEAYRGGGIYLEENFQPVTLRRLRLLDNRADRGGAIHFQSTNFTLSNSILAGNSAIREGGAIVARRDDAWWDPCPCPPTSTVGVFDFVVIHDNSAGTTGAVLWKDSPHQLRLSNSIMVDNTGATTVTVVAAEPTETQPMPPVVPPQWRYNDLVPAGVFEGMADPTGSDGNIGADPMFVDPDVGNFHLRTGSPAIDAGDPALQDPDLSRADMGRFGGPAGAP